MQLSAVSSPIQKKHFSLALAPQQAFEPVFGKFLVNTVCIQIYVLTCLTDKSNP